MHFRRSKLTSIAIACSLTLSACASGQEGTGQAIGALLAGGLCLALVNGKDKVACLAAGAAGFMIGGAIGRKMDERDRAKREAALRRALDDEALWMNHRGNGPMADNEVASAPPPKAAPRVDTASNQGVTWVNPDTKNSGSIEPLRTYVATNKNKAQCRQYRETYFKQGEPITETRTVCKDAKGQWG